MPSRYAQWMYDWEHRLTSVDNNRVVRPLEWGVEWAGELPCRNGHSPRQAAEKPEQFFLDYNRRIVASSDEYYSYTKPRDFRLTDERRRSTANGQRDASRARAAHDGSRAWNVRCERV